MIDLAASVWKLPLPETLLKITESQIAVPDGTFTDERIRKHVDEIVARRDTMRGLWANAQRNLESHSRTPGHNFLLTRFHLTINLSPELWRRGPGKILGASLAGLASKAFCPRTTVPGVNRMLRHSGTPLFRGRGWNEILVVPYYDLPDRLSAFFFVGRRGSKEDMVVKSIESMKGGLRGRDEVGLAGLDCVMPSDASNATVIAVNSPMLLARIQVRNAKNSMNPLPMVAYHHGETQWTHRAWQLLAGRKVVLWSWRMDAATVLHAMKVNGHISLASPEDLSSRSVDHYLRSCDAGQMFQKIVRQARPWRVAVSAFLTGAEDHQAEGLLLGLKREKVDISDLRKELTSDAAAIANRLCEPAKERRVTPAPRANAAYVEEGGNLYYHSPNHKTRLRPIMNAYLRFDRIVLRDGRTKYHGRLLMAGKEIRFEAPSTSVENDLPAYLVKVARQNGAILYVQANFGSGHLMTAALGFQQPIHDTGGAEGDS